MEDNLQQNFKTEYLAVSLIRINQMLSCKDTQLKFIHRLKSAHFIAEWRQRVFNILL